MAIALVTGSSSGIGLATAVTLARGGHEVIATMRNLDGAGELQEVLAAEKLPVTISCWTGRGTVPEMGASKTDEEVIKLGGASDEEYQVLVKREFAWT
jgi:NAD(P)-dependent dehydrogenase (short-subunit alcohol dehydrogenase family)